MAATAGRVEPCPRRIRAVLDDDTVVDTTQALYVWEWPGYPQFHLPLSDVHEQVFVHPRNPYTRVDALRSTRRLRVEIAGAVLAKTSAPVLVFETGLPTRYYVPRTDVDFTHLHAVDARSECPYKGRTSGYWSAEVRGETYPEVAWAYDFPTTALTAVAGMVAFANEDVDLFLDGRELARESGPAASRRTK